MAKWLRWPSNDRLADLLADRSGAAAAEYALLIAALLASVVLGFEAFGTALQALFQSLADFLSSFGAMHA